MVSNARIVGDLDGSRLCEECSGDYATRKVRIDLESRGYETLRRLCDSCAQKIGAVDDYEEEPPSSVDGDNLYRYLNDYGEVRIKNIRGRLDIDTEEGLKTLDGLYLKWHLDHEYLGLEVTIEEGEKRETTWKALKVAKRGNDVANRILQARFKPLKKMFRESDFSLDGEHTCLLYLTDTYDPGRCTRTEAWENIGKELNRQLSRLRKKHGKISVLRTWEAFENGYPHVHMLVYFHETSFPYFTHRKKKEPNKGKETHRIPNFQRKWIADTWHSFVDVQAVVGNGMDRLDDLLSYIIKFKDSHVDPTTWNKKELRTMSLTWYFGLRQFSVSKGFFGNLTKGSCVTQTPTLQLDLMGQSITTITYEVLGLFKGRDARIPPEVWEKTYDKRPPWLSYLYQTSNMRNANAPSILKGMGFK